MSPSSIQSSSRPTTVAAYQTSSPRHPSPLNPSPKSFSPPLPSSHTPRNSPVDEMSDTLSPLRECPEPGMASPPRPSSAVTRSRTPSLSRSPERSPVMCAIPHHAYARHPSPSNSPHAQNIPFPASAPLAGPSQSPRPQSPRPIPPSRQGSPASFHTTRSQFQTSPLRSPPHPTQSHFSLAQNSPVQVLPSPSARYPRTQSLIQQSFGNSYAAQVASSPPGSPRNRRVSLGAESRPHSSSDTPALIKGESMPLNEAPIRWWGGRRSWDDDWDNVAHGHQACDHFSSPGEFDSTMGMAFVQPGCGNPFAFREPFGCGGGPGAFMDDEIRASFDSAGGMGTCFTEQMTGHVHAPMGASVGYTMEGIPVPRTLPMPMLPKGTRSEIRHDNVGYGGACAGLPPMDGPLQTMSEDLARRRSCHIHMQGNPSGYIADGIMSVHGQESGQNALGLEQHGWRSRRFSDASTHSSTSFASCTSGPSQSLMSPSQSHTSTCPSLSSLGIGIEEAEREELRSRTFWGRKSGSTIKRESKDLSHATGGHNEDVGHGCPSCQSTRHGEKEHVGSPRVERVGNIKTGGTLHRDASEAKSPPTHDKDTVKHHGSLLARVGLKHGNASASDDQAGQEGYNRAERCVSLAITSILPAATVTTLSPMGEALVRAKESVRYVGQEIAPVVKEALSMSTDALKFAPCAGLEEAAKVLLSVWDACQKVDTNRLSCLRLAERCANLLYSVRCEFDEVGENTTQALAEPVQRLCGALLQIRTFLETQLHRPFLKRYVRREEIGRELQACNDAITDAASKFGISIQIRTYHRVCTAAVESKRVAQEAQALLSLDHQIIQSHYAIMYGQQVLASMPRMGLPAGTSSGSTGERFSWVQGEEDNGGSCRLTPPPASGRSSPPTTASSLSSRDTATSSTKPGCGYGQNMPMLSTGQLSDASETTSAPPTPTQPKTRTVTTETGKLATPPTSPMTALREVHRAQDSADAAADEAALRGTLEGALGAQNDVAMVRCLQVARGEIPEAAETLLRLLDVGAQVGLNGYKYVALEGEKHEGNTELDQRFMRGGIEAMTRLTNVDARQSGDEGERVGVSEGAGAVEAQELPSWTITRYEVVRRRKIGAGFFADVYLGHWRDRAVVIKVLAHSISREAFVRQVELCTALDHPNVLPLYGASSAVGEKPWFFVNEFCGGGSLVAALRGAKEKSVIKLGDLATMRVDLLRFMHEIAGGMAYLHGRGVLHGDLRAANVLVNANGRCMISGLGQCEIKAEARRSCRRSEPHPVRWRAPETLVGDGRLMNAADVYAFAMCCVEILGMGDLPWASLDDKAICELVLDKDERPSIPEVADVTEEVSNLVSSCWVREPERRPSFANIATSLEDAWKFRGHGSPLIHRVSPPSTPNKAAPATPAHSSPGDDQYETASESMATELEEEEVDDLTDVPLTSPAPGIVNGNMACSVVHIDTSKHAGLEILTQPSSDAFERQSQDTPTISPTSRLDMDTRNEEIYRLIVGANHAFHTSLTLPLWTPTRVELGAVGYLSKPSGEFVTLFNAIDPLHSAEEPLRRLPSMYGYGKFEVQKREDGKRSVAQRGLDAISGFLTFKARGDRTHPERIARQYTFSLTQGKPSAHLCTEKTVHRYMDHLEAPTTWFEQHVDLILDVYGARHGIRRQDLILVVGTLDASDWAMFVSDDHADGRTQFNVFGGREKGEPWGMFTMEGAVHVKTGNAGSARWADVGQGTFANKVSCVKLGGGHDVADDTVMLAGLRFERGIKSPSIRGD